MAEEAESGVGVDVKTGFGSLKLSGAPAVIVLLFIAILADIGYSVYENRQRSQEHTQVECMIKLALFIQTAPRGDPIDWNKMPVDLYPCVPRFLYQRTQE